jgi:hypothetical protein
VRCPYCGKPNEEAAEVCRHCSQELPSDPRPWRGPETSSKTAAPGSVEAANDEWDPARRYSQPRSTSGFVAPARYPDYLGWSIAVLVMCFLPTGVIALLCSLRVRAKHTLGDADRAYRYSQMAKFWCWISFILGLALYFIVIYLILAPLRDSRLSLTF